MRIAENGQYWLAVEIEKTFQKDQNAKAIRTNYIRVAFYMTLIIMTKLQEYASYEKCKIKQ